MTLPIAGAVVLPRDIFRVNDINLSIPPSQISVRKEDLIWSWKTLRTKASTKVPSGHGMVQASLSIYFTPDLLLDLIRLIVQFRHSPFCWVENEYLRQSICPHWPLYQSMAFTMSSIHVAPFRGHPGTFICEIDLRWFNYFPYAFNYLFRREWLTEPLKNQSNNVQLSIPTYGRVEGIDLPVTQTIITSPQDLANAIEEYDVISGAKRDIVAGSTVQDMEARHGGVVFDNMPLPNRMAKSEAVQDPAASNIYVRYINSLMQKRLWEGFGIDAAGDIIDAVDERYWSRFTAGEEQPSRTFRIVRRLNDISQLPAGVADEWITKILATTKYTTFTWHQYLSVELPPKLQKAMKEFHTKIIEGEVKKFQWMREETQKTLDEWASRKYGASYSSGEIIPGAKPGNEDSLNHLPWYPPCKAAPVTSVFTITPPYRLHPKLNKYLPHYGLDVGIAEGTPLYATNDGILYKEESEGGGLGVYIVHNPLDMRTRYLHMSGYADEVESGETVSRGQLIGYSGNTGRSSGPHLHFEMKKISTGQLQDPFILLTNQSFWNSNTDYPEDVEASDFGTDIDTDLDIDSDVDTDALGNDVRDPDGDSPNVPSNSADIEKGLGDGGAIGLTDEEKQLVADTYAELIDEGWVYYEKDQSVTNVWQRAVSIMVDTDWLLENKEATGELLFKEGAIISSMAGSLQHVIASIPILGHEFPTHQHLGSIEPNYMIEFALLDDGEKNTGIGTIGKMLETMRASLQENARTFRIIPDCWTLATDHFITRLFGSYSETDILLDDENGQTEIKKRSAISASQTETKQGNPGLSAMVFEFSETNPYETEFIVAEPSLVDDIEDRRKEVLHALYDMSLSDPGKTAAILAMGEMLSVDEIDSFRQNDEWKAANGRVGGKDQSVVTFDNFSVAADPMLLTAGAVGLPPSSTDQVDPVQALIAQAAGIGTIGYQEHLDLIDIDTALRNSPELDPLYAEGAGFVSETRNGDFYFKAGEYPSTTAYDATEFYRLYPELEGVDLDELAGLYSILRSLLRATRRMLVDEGVPNAHGADEVWKRLYEMPDKAAVKPQMYSQFVYYLAQLLGGDTGIERLHLAGIGDRYIDLDAISQEDKEELRERELLNSMKSGIWQLCFDAPTQLFLHTLAAYSFFNDAGIQVLSGTDIGDIQWGQLNKNLKLSYQSEKAQDAVDEYVWLLPIDASVPEQLANSFPLLGDVVSRGGDLSQSFGLHASFDKFLLSSWLIHARTSAFWPEIMKANRGNIQAYQTLVGAAERAFPDDPKVQAAIEQAGKEASSVKWTADAPGESKTQEISEAYKAAAEAVIEALPQSHIRFPCSTSIESNKISWLKKLYQTLADRILESPRLLALFGLEDLLNFDAGSQHRGSECYPDLDLPKHPYYPENFNATSPDFYMWNMYEDGPGALTQEMLQVVSEQATQAIQGPYEHLKSMMGNGIKPFAERDEWLTVYGDDGSSELTPRLSALRASWEGSDENLVKMGSEYISMREMQAAFPDPEALEEWRSRGDDGLRELGNKVKSLKGTAQSVEAVDTAIGMPGINDPKSDEYTQAYSLENLYKTLVDLQQDIRPLSPLLSAFDGNPQYTQIPRADLDTYKDLVKKVQETKTFFGSRAGYLGDRITKDTAKLITDSTTDTRVAALDAYTHAFDPASLLRLAQDSAADILSEKMTLRRAYPTFKLMFVEEDEFESRWLNFDDFHSYNSVKEFTIVRSRDMAASTAHITLQNVSGTLDGTKRNVITDLDYFQEAEIEQIEGDAKYTMMDARSESAPRIDSSQDQPFGALVLRPGLNVQLRVGFSNDPGMLEVMLSGRVTDVTWSTNGDMAEIVVQSFGTELVQALKGRDEFYDQNGEPNAEQEIYETTHKLLGSMMLSPELRHFGRWEWGQLYQYGESKDSRLDFYDYARDSFLNKFKVMTGVSRWIARHPVLTCVSAIGLAALATFTPIRGGAGFLSKGLAGFGRVGRWIGLGRAAATVSDDAARIAYRTATARTAQRVTRATARALNRSGGASIGQKLTALEARSVATAAASAAEKVAVGSAGRVSARQIFQASSAGRKLAFIETAAASGTSVDAAVSASLTSTERLAYISKLVGFKGGPAPVKFGVWTAGGFKPAAIGAGKFAFGRLGAFTGAGLRLTSLGLGVAGALDLSRYLLFTPLYHKTIGNLKKWYARNKVSLMLSPQDDNLYPPSPKDYMRIKPPGFKEAVGRVAWGAGNSLFSVATLTGNTDDTVENWWKAWHKSDWMLDKRVEPQQCVYRPQNSTIWDIFHEMSLRHPGWIYGAVPYGNSFRYTMFFGVPSQRYWSKPAGNDFIFRMNMLRDMLDKGEITNEQYKRLYGTPALDKLAREVDDSHRFVTDIVGADYPNAEAFDDSSVKTALTIKMTNQAMDEYLKGLEARFVPFRRYHMLTSEQDIVANNIMSSEHNVANAVSAMYMNVEDKDVPAGSVTVKANTMLPEHNVRTQAISYPNCRGYTMGLRYAMGQLMYEMKQMYRGELLVLGNPRIRPWDQCILMDRYTDMFGPIEVEQVVDMFSHETGYLTEIKPNAVVFANEIATWPIIEALKLFVMAVKDNESGRTPMDPDQIIEKAWGDSVSDEFKEHMSRRYGELFAEGFRLEDIYPNQNPDALGIREGTGGLAAAADSVGTLALTGAVALVAGATTLAGVKVAGTLGRSSSMLTKVFGGMALGAVSGGVVAQTAETGIAAKGFLIDRLADPLGMTWLIAGPILFNKCLEEDVIAVIPLLKNGQPVVSGLTYKDPLAFWTSIRGRVSNIVDDTYEGTRDQLTDWKMYGFEWWRRYKDEDKDALLGC